MYKWGINRVISIHALLAESDFFLFWCILRLYISIHALLAESDNTGQPVRGLPSYFYPRSPCGERPAIGRRGRAARGNFYPRSPCGERPRAMLAGIAAPLISIHALLAESDGWFAGRAVRDPQISIHALLAESDGCRCPPRHWHGGFLSTLSLRRATRHDTQDATPIRISIHALLAESDLHHSDFSRLRNDFYPRSPCGERPGKY